MKSSILTTLALMGCSTLSTWLVAAETAPLPSVVFSVEGIRSTQDYRSLRKVPGMDNLPIAQQRQFMDPWGVWRPGIHVRLAISRPEGWSLLSTDQIKATARLDSGEVLADDPSPVADEGIMSDASLSRNADTTLWPTQGRSDEDLSTIGLDLIPPTKACRSISSLQGRLRLVLGDLSDLKTIHVIPTSGEPQTVPGTGMVIELTKEGKIKFGFTVGTLKACHDVKLFAADGVQLESNNTVSEGNNDHMTMTFVTSKPIAAVDLHLFQHYRAILAEFTFSDLNVAGMNDPALLTRKSTAVQELAVPNTVPVDTSIPAAPPAIKKGVPPF